MSIEWDGVGKRGVLRDDLQARRDALADAAKAYDWPGMLAMVRAGPSLANAARPGGKSGFAPLHQAAHGGAPVAVVEELVALGAWRTLRDGNGRRPVDVAQARGHAQLIPVLAPALLRQVPPDTLAAIESGFHRVVRGRIGDLEDQSGLRLPQLAPMLEVDCAWWFPVPGMYGGFAYNLVGEGASAMLVSDSWCRVAEGSEERHEIDAGGSRLIERERPPMFQIIRQEA